MKIISLSEARKVPFDFEGYIMHSTETLEVIHLCLKPGQIIPQHKNPFDVVACLIEGEVVLETGENQYVLSLFDVAELEKDTERGFTNNGTSDARLIILKKLQSINSLL